MASIVKIPSGYRAFIMLKGIRKSKSFKSKYSANEWARKEENLIMAKVQQPEQSVYRPKEIFLYLGKDSQLPKHQEPNRITFTDNEFEALFERAAEIGAKRAILALVTYNIKDAAAQLNMDPKTLSKRISEKKLKLVDGRITGAELMRYLKESAL
jgi:hypothetical protein